jgi:hypothetical protein
MDKNKIKKSAIIKLDDLKNGLYHITLLGKEEIVTCFYYAGYTTLLSSMEIVEKIVKKYGEGEYVIVEIDKRTQSYDRCCSFSQGSLIGVDYTTYQVFKIEKIGGNR